MRRCLLACLGYRDWAWSTGMLALETMQRGACNAVMEQQQWRPGVRLTPSLITTDYWEHARTTLLQDGWGAESGRAGCRGGGRAATARPMRPANQPGSMSYVERPKRQAGGARRAGQRQRQRQRRGQVQRGCRVRRGEAACGVGTNRAKRPRQGVAKQGRSPGREGGRPGQAKEGEGVCRQEPEEEGKHRRRGGGRRRRRPCPGGPGTARTPPSSTAGLRERRDRGQTISQE